MCGVVGVVHLDGAPASAVAVERMADMLAHRGPDDSGVFTHRNIGLGHRRLAVIDLSPRGRQPMVHQRTGVIVSYNGEIYNFRELRADLAARGHEFRSDCDAEVLCAAWAEWGTSCLDRLNGMFAFAVYDPSDASVYLCRDRVGVKPLYWAQAGNTVLFASEVKGILAHGAHRAALDRSALLEYFTFQNYFTSRTLFDGVSLLPAGSFVRIDAAGGSVGSPSRYWDFDFHEPDAPLSADEYCEEFQFLFEQAVKRQLVSDVAVGSYLSGGMDSGSITAVASSVIPGMPTFTVGFDTSSASGLEIGHQFDERPQAELLSYRFGTEQYEMVLKAGDMERALAVLTWHLEEPRVGQSYPNFYAAKLASRFSTVVLAGTGGDELFGGYPWRYYRAVVNSDFEHYIDKYYDYWHRLVPNQTLKQLFAPIAGDVEGVWTRDIFRDVFASHADTLTDPTDYVNHSLYFEAKTFLHGLLVVEDKLSMAHGLESRVPFLDNDLMDFAQRVPVAMKLGNLAEIVRLDENEPGPKTAKYFEKTTDGKLVMRRAMQKFMPSDALDMPKQGFSAPDDAWFRGESIDYVRSVLLDRESPLYEVLDPRVVRGLVDDHLAGRTNRRLLIWSLLSVDQWMRTFLGRDLSGGQGSRGLGP